MMVWCLFF